MIKIEGLNKYYNKGKNNEIHVIDNVSIELPENGLVTLLGKSGSGKTTLLNVIGGLDKAVGKINYGDLVVDKYSASKIDSFRRENVGYVFQNYNLIKDISVWNNLKVALEIIGINDPEEVEKRITYALKAVGLYKYRKKSAYALSGGQQQRVSIARALVKNSKIIIADEPTGNLDSQNSFEIMKILKKVSEKSLVLLVTHDSKLAEHYSDRIIEISDGKIINEREGARNASFFSRLAENKVYLKDLKLKEINGNQVNVNVYQEDDTDTKLDFKIIEHNGTYYIESNVKIQLVQNSPLEIVDDHYQETEMEQDDDFEFDTSWYNNTKTNNTFKRIWTNIKDSFQKFSTDRKLQRFFHIACLLIGVIVAFINTSLVEYMRTDISNVVCEPNTFVAVDSTNDSNNGVFSNNYINTIKEAYKAGYIEYVGTVSYYYSITYKSWANSYVETTTSAPAIYSSNLTISGASYLAGREIQNSKEIVLGKGLADRIIEGLNDNQIQYDYLIGTKIDGKTICGIVDVNSTAVYQDTMSVGAQLLYQSNPFNVDYNDKALWGYYDYEVGKYKVISGSDLSEEDTNSCLLYVNTSDMTEAEIAELDVNDYNGFPIYINGKDFNIKGLITAQQGHNIVPEVIIRGEVNKQYLDSSKPCLYMQGIQEASYRVVEGRDVQNDFEILVSAYSGFAVGEQIEDCVVVGKYILDANDTYSFTYGLLSTCLTTNRTRYFLSQISYQPYYEYVLQTNDAEALINFMAEKGFILKTIYDNGVDRAVSETKAGKLSTIPVVLVLLAITIIYIFFNMRSKMVSDIYTIGIYRALGYTKYKLVGKTAVDILVTVALTTLLGYVATLVIYDLIASALTSVGFNMFTCYDFYTTYAIGAIMILGNVIIGIIPILSLLSKTPSEIISKYDI